MFENKVKSRKGKISEEDRRKLIDKLNKPFSIVGKDIPDQIYIDGKNLDLNNIVLDLIKRKNQSEEDIKITLNLKKMLFLKQKEDETDLENSDLTEGEANILYEEILGIKRAILALEDVGKKDNEDLKNFYRTNEVEDIKRWVKYLKKFR